MRPLHVLRALVLLSIVGTLGLRAQAPDSGRAVELLRVKASGMRGAVMGTLAPVGPDSVRFLPSGAEPPRTLATSDIVSVERQTGVERNILGGALAGAGVGALGGWWGGPVAYASAYGAV